MLISVTSTSDIRLIPCHTYWVINERTEDDEEYQKYIVVSHTGSPDAFLPHSFGVLLSPFNLLHLTPNDGEQIVPPLLNLLRQAVKLDASSDSSDPLGGVFDSLVVALVELSNSRGSSRPLVLDVGLVGRF
jgi:hypothetical protein